MRNMRYYEPPVCKIKSFIVWLPIRLQMRAGENMDKNEKVVRLLSPNEIYDYEAKYERVREFVEEMMDDGMHYALIMLRDISKICNIHDPYETYVIYDQVVADILKESKN